VTSDKVVSAIELGNDRAAQICNGVAILRGTELPVFGAEEQTDFTRRGGARSIRIPARFLSADYSQSHPWRQPPPLPQKDPDSRGKDSADASTSNKGVAGSCEADASRDGFAASQ
jgi:hypothetical protein